MKYCGMCFCLGGGGVMLCIVTIIITVLDI